MLLLLGDPALTRFFHALQVERCQSYYCRRPLLFVPLVGLLTECPAKAQTLSKGHIMDFGETWLVRPTHVLG